MFWVFLGKCCNVIAGCEQRKLTCAWEKVLLPSKGFDQWDIESWCNAISITCTDVRRTVAQGVGNMIIHSGKISALLPASEQELASVLLREPNIGRMEFVFLAIIPLQKFILVCKCHFYHIAGRRGILALLRPLQRSGHHSSTLLHSPDLVCLFLPFEYLPPHVAEVMGNVSCNCIPSPLFGILVLSRSSLLFSDSKIWVDQCFPFWSWL